MKFHGKNTISVREGIEFRDHGGHVRRLINQETVGSKRLTVSIVFLNPGMKRLSFSFKVQDLPMWRDLGKRRSKKIWHYGYHRMPNTHSETRGMNR
jgi:hypothetical protein